MLGPLHAGGPRTLQLAWFSDEGGFGSAYPLDAGGACSNLCHLAAKRRVTHRPAVASWLHDRRNKGTSLLCIPFLLALRQTGVTIVLLTSVRRDQGNFWTVSLEVT